VRTLPTNDSFIAKLESLIVDYRKGMLTGQECVFAFDDDRAVHAEARKSSVSEPANPAWNCCVLHPAAVARFADGTAMVICRKDTAHFPKCDVFPLPATWKFNPAQDD
jgi:hypothetical protein